MPVRTKEFYKFQNKVMEKLGKTNLSPNEGKYCWTLFRESFGRGEEKVKIKGSKIAEKTDIYESNISDIQKRLKKRKIIYVNGRIKGFNPNTEEWEKLQPPITFKNLQVPIRKSYSHQEEKVIATNNTILVTKRKLQEGGVGLKKLTPKEKDKLEGKAWLRVDMLEQHCFSKAFIDDVLSKYEFMTLYDCWLDFLSSNSVRYPEGWYINKLRNYQEEED